MAKLRYFLLNSKDTVRASYIWNMIGSMIMAFQSVIMLIIITRILSLYEAGVFTLAYASANLFLNIGKYGMRNFQVSDLKHQFTFSDYRFSRIITTFIMFTVSVIYVIVASKQNDYSMDKAWVIIWMCLFKMVDSFEDVYLGLYQQQGRLDVSGKMLSLRMISTVVLFAACLIISRNLLVSLVISTIFTSGIMVCFILLTYSQFENKQEKVEIVHIFSLLKKCFPLFLGCFLAFYIGNAPKYAIDSNLNDELQACYGFIAMPVFVIGLLNNFIFNPMITQMSLLWKEGNHNRFIKMFIKQMIIVAVITLICEAGAYVLGIPVLSVLYNTDLSPYKTELLVLLLGGGFLALSGLLVTIMTIIRIQGRQAIGYIIVAIFAFVLSPIFVREYKILGAAVLYLLLMVLLCVIFGILLWAGLRRERV